MQNNVGQTDKLLRIGAGVLLLGLGAAGVIDWWGALGLVPLATGLLNRCPLYTLLGINTCRLKG